MFCWLYDVIFKARYRRVCVNAPLNPNSPTVQSSLPFFQNTRSLPVDRWTEWNKNSACINRLYMLYVTEWRGLKVIFWVRCFLILSQNWYYPGLYGNWHNWTRRHWCWLDMFSFLNVRCPIDIFWSLFLIVAAAIYSVQNSTKQKENAFARPMLNS